MNKYELPEPLCIQSSRTAQSTFFAHHEEEFNLHIGYELVRDRRDDAFLASDPAQRFQAKWGHPNAVGVISPPPPNFEKG